MITNLILPINIFLSLLSFGLITRWYITPWLTKLPLIKALTPLLLLHSFRHIGMTFLIPGVTAQILDARFANPAAYGDLLASILAFTAIAAIKLEWKSTILWVWVFNLVGTIDLINALAQGLRHTTDGHLGATYFIPAIVVPALLVSHTMIFSLLLIQHPKKNTTTIDKKSMIA